MCDIDSMYSQEELEANAEEIINDELLIAYVKANDCLYNKQNKDFKDTKLKADKWTAIALACGAPSGEAAERRWVQLRNYFGKKIREMREQAPSGSGGGKISKPWEYMGAMGFLLPHMENRKKRGSLLAASGGSRPGTPVPNGGSRPGTPAPSVGSRPATPFQIQETPALPTGTSSPLSSPPGFTSPTQNLWDSTSTIFSPPNEEDEIELMNESSGSNDIDDVTVKKTAAGSKKRKSGPIPEDDKFASRKKQKLDGLELAILTSAETMSKAAKDVFAGPSRPQPQETLATNKPENPYMTALKKAFEDVPESDQLTCFMAMMDVIKNKKY